MCNKIYIRGPPIPRSNEHPTSCGHESPQSAPEHMNVSVTWRSVFSSLKPINLSVSPSSKVSGDSMLVEVEGSQSEFNIVLLKSVFGGIGRIGVAIKFIICSSLDVLGLSSISMSSPTAGLFSVLSAWFNVSFNSEYGVTGTFIVLCANISFSLWMLLILFSSDIYDIKKISLSKYLRA